MRFRLAMRPPRTGFTWSLLLLIGLFAHLPAAYGAPPDRASKERDAPWWRAGYGLDYGLIAFGGLLYLVPSLAETPQPASIGPVYDPASPSAVLDARYADKIGRTYTDATHGEMVPTRWVGYALGAGFGWLVVQELPPWSGGDEPNAQRLHDTLVGYLEGLALTLGTMEALKVGVGRLRPDFQERALRYHCHTDIVAGLDCAGVPPLASDPKEARWILNDGRKSFLSGHAATSAFMSSYLIYAIGGRYVWGSTATSTSRSVGLVAQGLLLSAGVFTASSRYMDARHHISDIIAGSALGLSMAALAYWRRFDTSGKPRRRVRTSGTPKEGDKRRHKVVAPPALTWRVTPNVLGRGLSLQGRF